MAKSQEPALDISELNSLLLTLSDRLDTIQKSQTELHNLHKVLDERLLAVEEAVVKQELSGPEVQAAIYSGMNPGTLFQSILGSVIQGMVSAVPGRLTAKPQYLAREIQNAIDKTQEIMLEISKRTPTAFKG